MKSRYTFAITPSMLCATVLTTLLSLPPAINAQDTEPASATGAVKKSAVATSADTGRVWTCPMHPQIHRSGDGHCPICAMALAPVNRDDVALPATLDQMLSIALKHNPDVRAARAKLMAAEAELDRTRLTVLQRIIAYRERWSAQKASLAATGHEVEAARNATTRDNLSEAQKKQLAIMLAAAKQKLAFEQARLREVEAELPFLLGRQAGRADEDSTEAGTAIISDRLIPLLEQSIKVSTEEYRKGQAELSDMISQSQRLAELRVQIASTKTEQIEIVQAHIILLKDMQKMADQRYKAGGATLKDVLAAQIQVAEAELWLAKVKGDSQ